jgi:hypothetical protein
VGTTNPNPTPDSKAAHQDDTDTRNFIETHDVTKVARKAVPGSGEESADLLQDDAEVGRSQKGT